MNAFFASAAMAFLMFSVIPMPMVDWKKENMRYMLCCLPLVGLVIGPALLGWFALCRILQFGNLLYSAGLTLIPVFLSGGIHLDGFCDTIDALSSHAEPTRKREILKDSHAGAFAIIYAVCYFVLYLALCSETPFTWKAVYMLGVFQVFSRVVGAMASVFFPGSTNQGLLATFRDASKREAAWILSIWGIACIAIMLIAGVWAAIVSSVLAGLCMLYVYRTAKREFGGMSGDLAGLLISLTQLVLLLGYVITERITTIWF